MRACVRVCVSECSGKPKHAPTRLWEIWSAVRVWLFGRCSIHQVSVSGFLSLPSAVVGCVIKSSRICLPKTPQIKRCRCPLSWLRSFLTLTYLFVLLCLKNKIKISKISICNSSFDVLCIAFIQMFKKNHCSSRNSRFTMRARTRLLLARARFQKLQSSRIFFISAVNISVRVNNTGFCLCFQQADAHRGLFCQFSGLVCFVFLSFQSQQRLVYQIQWY